MRSLIVRITAITFLGLSSCKSQKTSPTPVTSWSGLKENNRFVFDAKIAVNNNALKEISGIASGRTNKELLYVHEDSFCPNKVYLLNTKGEYQGSLKLKGRKNWDWEDIAVGGGPEESKHYIYVGDIGDNFKLMNAAIVYRFEEPNLTNASLPIKSKVYRPDKLRFQYPDGRHNAETLLLDPLTKDLYIVTKGKTATIYRAEFPQNSIKSTKLEYIGSLPISQATGGSISSDGKEIIIKDYYRIYYWKRLEGQSINEALTATPELLPYQREMQGEAVGFNNDNSGYYTISEIESRKGLVPTLYFYKRK
ncbi:hypothetical protein D3C80_192960 [compost metagenome]